MGTIIKSMMDELSTVTLAMIAGVQWFVVAAHQSEPIRLNEKAFLVGMGIYGIYILYLCIKPYWAFRPPTERSQ